jgi:hypothetical protein
VGARHPGGGGEERAGRATKWPLKEKGGETPKGAQKVDQVMQQDLANKIPTKSGWKRRVCGLFSMAQVSKAVESGAALQAAVVRIFLSGSVCVGMAVAGFGGLGD